LKIVTATTGESQPQGYTLHITGPGGTADPSIGATDSVTFTDVAPGDYSVELRNVPTNCAVNTASGPNPRTVTVPPGDTGRTTFSVTCTATAPTTGTLSITTSTTGQDLPPGYTLTVTGPSFPTGTSTTIGASANVTAT